MRHLAIALLLVIAFTASAAEVESRVLTHYVPQDLLETAVRTEGWTEVPLKLAGGTRKGDVVRIWAGGSIDRGNGDHPGDNVNGPDGVGGQSGEAAKKLALSQSAEHAFALLVKTDGNEARKCLAAGKPLEVKLTKDNEKLWLGFNDERGRYQDNHLGKGRHHELDPLWLRVEVVRLIVD
ncbi:MAG TPA: hypothetical protein VKA46_40690 [Gemmataceae bacterium]|nr:hypothetical protein [Gemmataceae bacterium]